MKYLKELGVDTSKASMALIYTNKYEDIIDWDIVDKNIHEEDVGRYNPYLRKKYGAFTLQDILDLLPKELDTNTERYILDIWYGIYIEKWCVGYTYGECMYDDDCFTGDNLIDAAYELLVWCIENCYVETNKNE